MKENVELTQTVIHQIVHAWYEKQRDIVLAYSLGFQIENRIVLVSIMGHLEEIWEWLSLPISNIPLEKDKLDMWSEKIVNYLDKKYIAANDCPPLDKTLMESGLLAITRQIPQELKYEYFLGNEGLHFQFNPSSLPTQALELMQTGEITLSPSFILHELTCSNCGADYTQCKCNSLLDHDVARHIDSCTPLPPHWTDRITGST